MDWRYKILSIQEPDCIVYLDSYTKAGDGIVDAYVDFRQSKDVALFRQVFDLPDNSGTFIELRALRSSKRLMRGCFYKLNLILLKNYVFSRVEDSLLIGGRFDLSKMDIPEDDDTELLQQHEPLDPEELIHWNVPQEPPMLVSNTDDMQLFVKDVNQGNWNELRFGNRVLVLYDAGARLNASLAEVKSIFNSRKDDLEASKPMLVISHWDVDHIHCLKLLSKNDIPKYFSKLICVGRMKTVTASGIYDKFISALGKGKVYCLSPAARTNGIDMHLWKNMGCLSIYLGEQSRNINYCGIAMFVKGKRKSANFTGDCRLTQAKSVYDQERTSGLDTNEHVLVAPHHGGDYGAAYRHYSLPCKDIVISVGLNNSYGHPQKDMLRYLCRLGSVHMTKNVGDYDVRL